MIRLFRVFIPSTILGLVLSDLLILLSCYLAACAILIEDDFGIFLLYDGGWARILVAVASIILGLYFQDFYTRVRVRSRVLLVQQVCLAIGLTFLIQGFITYLSVSWRLPRRPMMLGSALVFVLLPAWRIFYAKVIFRIFGAERLIFFGTSPLLGQITLQLAEHPELSMKVLGYISDEGQVAPELKEEYCLGGVDQLKSIVATNRPDRLVIGLSDPRQQLPIQELLELRLQGIRIEDAASLYEAAFRRVCLEELRPSQFIFDPHFGGDGFNTALQATYSFFLALTGVVLSSPIMFLVWAAVRLTSPGPALFRQTRVGRNNATFTLFKFRSMYIDAEARTGAVWATQNDPRITPLGRWLRLTRLDEIPQLFNVLRGEMSIVGPRPERPEFVRPLAEQIPFYQHRHRVKPGITGWAQINYKYGNTLDDTKMKLEYDLYYIKNFSPSLDFFIMFHTAKIMLLTRGAH